MLSSSPESIYDECRFRVCLATVTRVLLTRAIARAILSGTTWAFVKARAGKGSRIEGRERESKRDREREKERDGRI